MPTPPNPDKIRLLVAGLGAFGREHLARLAARADVSVVAAADADPKALEAAGARFGVGNRFADPLRMIDETPADAIVVATPASSHVEIGARALERGLCALIEKPVAPSAAAAAPLIAAAARAKGFALPGHVLRFSRDHQRLVETVRSGEIGEVLYVNSRRYRDESHAVRYPDDDPVLMTMVHDIDLASWVAGDKFRTVLARRSHGPGFRSMTTVSATTTTEILCDLRTAWTFVDGDLPPDLLEVVGDRGCVELVVGRGLRVYTRGRCAEIPVLAGDDALANEHEHFLSCARDPARPRALDLADALAGLKFADAALASLREGREVAVGA